MQTSTLTNKYLIPEEDGLPMTELQAWAAEKLHYVKRYIYMFTTSMHKKPWRSIRYIDLFAGTGKCRVKNSNQILLGSTLLALTAEQPFTNYIFVDKNSQSINSLTQRSQEKQRLVQIDYYIGNSNIIVHDIVKHIQEKDGVFIPGKWKSLNLTVLDPYGLELEWKTIASLAQVEKMDLIIYYSQSGLTRNLKQCYAIENDTIIDRFFGDREWRAIYGSEQKKGKSMAGVHRHLIDYYKKKLRMLGYVDVRTRDEIETEPLVRNTKNAPLYRLLFASKHELGHKFWEEVTKKDVYGQRRLL